MNFTLLRRLPYRSFSTNPYRILGVHPSAPLDQVKRAFVELALQYHPDVNSGSTNEFLKIREAFEMIQESKGKSKSKVSSKWSKEELQQWYKEETGDFLTFDMSEQTRREVIHVYKTMKPSGRDKGGYWDMARMLAERESMRKDPDADDGPLKQLEGPKSNINRRKRRR